MAKVNYLLGHAEKMVEPIPPPKVAPDKAHPYTLSNAKRRLIPRIEATATALDELPKAACPHDEAVALLTLHPAYLAKSYFPDHLLDAANLRAVGSRNRIVSPDAWAVKNPPKDALTAELFVAGARKDFQELAAIAGGLREGTASALDLVKIEDVRSYQVMDRIRTVKRRTKFPYWEIILHATGLSESAYILDGFREYMRSLDLKVDLDERADSLGPTWKRSAHSSIGPGRSPGVIKPDLLSLGGSPKNPFYVIGADGNAAGCLGTSYGGPAGLRVAIGVRAYLGPILSPLALKALLIHRSYPSKLPQREVGWGKVSESLDELLKCEDTSATIVYQDEIAAGSWLRAPVPVPEEEMSGMVDLTATICFATDTDPQDPIHYTRSGLDVRFRPHDGKKIDPKQNRANSRPIIELPIRGA